MTTLHPHRQESLTRPLPPPTLTQAKTEPEKLIAFYCKLSVSERAACFSSTSYIAKRCGVSQRTVQHWINYNWIVAVKLGTNYKVYLPSVEEFLHHCAEV